MLLLLSVHTPLCNNFEKHYKSLHTSSVKCVGTIAYSDIDNKCVGTIAYSDIDNKCVGTIAYSDIDNKLVQLLQFLVPAF